MEECTSGWGNIDVGVPQGSVLGPFLFLVDVNNSVEGKDCHINFFADDSSLFVIFDYHNFVLAVDVFSGDIDAEVPQGSILGPCLFLVYEIVEGID